MSLKTQGSHLYFIDPDDNSVLEVECPRGISGLGGTIAEEDDTCLGDEAASFVPGAADGGTVTFDLNFDPAKESHVTLYDLFANKTENIKFAVGFSDDAATPDVDSDDDFDLPNTRSWMTFEGFITSIPLDLALNARVATTVSVRVSGFPQLIPKA